MKVTNEESARFWKKVSKNGPNGCWVWTASVEPPRDRVNGYGIIAFNKDGKWKRFLAHRISYILSGKKIPQKHHVLHKCDNPPCVNPEHLFVGTQKDNVHDCMRKNRRAHLLGEDHGRAKLTAEEVAAIKSAHRTLGFTQLEIAKQVGVTPTAINYIIKGKNWSHT